MTELHTHENGLSLTLPESEYDVEETERGFRLSPRNAGATRAATEIKLELHSGTDPDGEWPEIKTLGERQARYRVEVYEGGSGGQEFTLIAWESLPTSYLLLTQYEQREASREPDFAAGWKVLSQATVHESTEERKPQ